MKRPTSVSPNTLNRIFQEATEAWKRCDFQTAIEMYESVSRRDPANVGILLDLGRMHGQRYDYAAAERCFEKAIRLSGQKTGVLVAAAQQSRVFNHFSMAEGYLKRALERTDVPPTALVILAEICERQRRMEEAAALGDRALQADPACAPALLLRSRLARQAGNLEVAEKSLRSFPAHAEPGLRANAAYELGGILDRQGRFDEAMNAFLEAKALLQPLAARPAYEIKVMRSRVSHLTANATAEVLKQWHDAAGQLQPARRLALLGGHPRSGTTLLEQVLDAHPDVVSAEETEIFKQDAYIPLMRGHPDDTAMYDALAAATPAALQLARQKYLRSVDSSLGQLVGGRLLIDKNPTYTYLVAPLIRIFPEIKFLIALRDPRDVVMSCFMQNFPLNQVGAACLTLAGTVEEYTALMTAWQTIKPRMANPWLEVRYEDMVEDLESVARKTLTFLEMPWDDRVLGFDEHARKKMVRSPTYADVAQPVYKRAKGRWRNYQKYLEPHLEKLEPFLKAFGYEP